MRTGVQRIYAHDGVHIAFVCICIPICLRLCMRVYMYIYIIKSMCLFAYICIERHFYIYACATYMLGFVFRSILT